MSKTTKTTTLRVRTSLKAGGKQWGNHNQTTRPAKALRVRTSLKAGMKQWGNHNVTLRG